MGLIGRKCDSAATLRFMTWQGFNSFRSKFAGVWAFEKQAEGGTPVERFAEEVLAGVFGKERYMSRDEFRTIKGRLMGIEGVGNVEGRKRLAQIIKKVLIFAGAIEKVVEGE